MADSPILGIRLPEESKKTLREIAGIMGTTPSGFARELLEVTLSGEPKLIGDFNARLIQKLGEQMTLVLYAQAKEQTDKKVVQDVRPLPRKQGKKARLSPKKLKARGAA